MIRRFKDLGLLAPGYRSFWKGRFSVSVYFPGGVLFRLLHAALKNRGKARPHSDDLAEAWGQFCRDKGLDPVELIAGEEEEYSGERRNTHGAVRNRGSLSDTETEE